MTAQEILCRHFSRMGARVKLSDAASFQWEKVRFDVRRDGDGEFFEIRPRAGFFPEVIDVRPDIRHMVVMVRDENLKSKFLLGHDERHWFAAAAPGDHVRDVRTAIASLRPHEARTSAAIRQGEWFFVPAPRFAGDRLNLHRKEPLSRGAGSKPHICDELVRRSGLAVMVCEAHPTGLSLVQYERLIAGDARARRWRWRSMTRDAEVFARGAVRHPDHKTIHLDGWHRVYMNRERAAPHAAQIAFLD